MKFLVILLFLLPSWAMAGPAFDVVQHVALESASDIKGVCSGSIVRIADELYELTAAHCVQQPFDSIRFGVNQDGHETLGPAVSEIHLAQANYLRFDASDLALAKLGPNHSSGTVALEIRTTPLAMDEVVTVNGYGGGIGPQKILCTFRGNGLTETRQVQFGAFRYFTQGAGLICQAPLDANQDGVINEHDVAGFSGGPVLDRQNKMVGLISQTPNVRSDGSIEIVMIPLTNTKLISIGSGAMLVPREHVIEGDYVNLPSLRTSLAAAFGVETVHAKICMNAVGLPIAYQLPFDGKNAIGFVHPEAGLRPEPYGPPVARATDSIQLYSDGGAIDSPGTHAEYQAALAKWKAECE